jgi:hypothetical protein
MTATQTLDTTQAPAPRRVRALLPERIRAARRPRWWQEFIFVAICYELYSLIRNAVPDQEESAFRRATDLLRVEGDLHINVEHSVNAFVARTHALAYVFNYYYATMHFVVTIGVMVWLYRRHPLRYRALRSVLLATTITALLGFWLFALAPPRMLTGRGFVDTIVMFHTWGSWGSSGIDSASNQFAAMPSLHIAWSLWCALVVAQLARRTWVRVAALAYPLMTLFVIVGTANHFVLDAVGGVVALALGFAVNHVLSGRGAFAGPEALPRQRQAKNTLS